MKKLTAAIFILFTVTVVMAAAAKVPSPCTEQEKSMNITMIVKARNTVRNAIVRPEMITALSPLKELNNADSATIAVVVFKPPAAEPGEPPISISTITSVRQAGDNVARSTVEYPAVRDVAERKQASKNCRSPPDGARLIR